MIFITISALIAAFMLAFVMPPLLFYIGYSQGQENQRKRRSIIVTLAGDTLDPPAGEAGSYWSWLRVAAALEAHYKDVGQRISHIEAVPDGVKLYWKEREHVEARDR